jgi:hypothetical protein
VANCNFQEKPLSREQVDEIKGSIQKVVQIFPKLENHFKYILLSEEKPTTVMETGEEEMRGEAREDWNVFILYPRALEKTKYRFGEISNLEGTVIHELGHLIQKKYIEEYRSLFEWITCITDDPEVWELVQTESKGIGTERPKNKLTGEIAGYGVWPKFPETCVSQYAKQEPMEDFCESLTAFICSPKLLNEKSPEKYNFFKSIAEENESNVKIKSIAKEKIPEPEKKSYKLFIREPLDNK